MLKPCSNQYHKQYQKASGSTLWFDLRSSGHYHSETPSLFQVERPGIESWSALVDLISFICISETLPPLSTPGFYIAQWCLDTLQPDEKLLQALSILVEQEHLQGIDLLLCNNIEIIPDIIHISSKNLDAEKNGTEKSDTAFWKSNEAQNFLNTFIDQQPEYGLLYNLLQSSDQFFNKSGFKSLEAIFEQNDLYLDYSEETQSGLWQHVKNLQDTFLTGALQHHWSIETHVRLLLNNPVFQACQKINSLIEGGVYSIGAGQMIATLDLTRQLIDQGLLSQNTPLIADNRAGEGIYELQCCGKRKSILGDLWVNPEDRKPIAVQNASLRQDLIEKYKPAIIFLNVKAQALVQIFSDSFCTFLAALDYTPILVMPSKSYTLAGHTPYQALYDKLLPFKAALAENLTVLGGFYAAPSILTGDLIHMTAASASPEAALQVSGMLCPVACDLDGTTTKVGATSLELQTGPNTAAMLMAGGANKNYLTYTAARHLLEHAFSLDHTQPQQWLQAIDERICQQRQHNVDYSQVLTAQLLRLDANQLSPASPGLVTDFVHCLPLTGRGICALVEQSYRIQKHILRTPPAQRAQVAQQHLSQLIQNIRQDSQRLLGTRNARDGFIDELIAYFYNAWLTHKSRLPLAPVELALFYKTFYPKEWLGDSAQEGRNGILPVIVKASLLASHDQWFQELMIIWGQYYPVESSIPENKRQPSYEKWHNALLRLLVWVSEQDTGLLDIGRSKLKEWVSATETHRLIPEPAIMPKLRAVLDSQELTQECIKLIRDF